MVAWKMNLLFGARPIFRRILVSFRECNLFVPAWFVEAELIKQPNIDGFLVTGNARWFVGPWNMVHFPFAMTSLGKLLFKHA